MSVQGTAASDPSTIHQQAYYNPRPRPVDPAPRVEVEEVRTLTGNVQTRVRVLLGTEGASSLSSVFTLCNTAIGAGVLGLPYAFGCAGLVGCLLLFVAVAALESFTMYVLAKFAERYDAGSYGQLIRRALGRKTGALLAGVTVIYLWGSSVAYLIVVADTFTSLSAMYFGAAAWSSNRVLLILIVSFALLPLCFPRNLSAMEYVSGAAVFGFLYTSAAISYRGIQAVAARADPWEGVSLWQPASKSLYALPLVVFGFNCHANVISVFYELEHRPHTFFLPASPSHYQSLGRFAPKPYTYKLIGMLGATLAYMTIIFLGYTSVGITGYLAYPGNVSSNVLNSFPADDIVVQIARAAIGGVCMGSYPLNHHPARAAWEDLFDSVANIRTLPGWLSSLLTVTFVASTSATAMAVTDLGSVLHMIGGTAAPFMILTLPGLLLLNAAIIKHTAGGAAADGQAAGPVAPADDEAAPPFAQGEDEEAAEALAASMAADPSPLRSSRSQGDLGAPLLDYYYTISKKAGFRDAGLVFAPAKSWWAGMALVVISGVVMAVTLLT